MSSGARTLLREDAGAAEDIVAPALPLNDGAEPLVAEVPQELPEALPLEPARALVLADFQPPQRLVIPYPSITWPQPAPER